MPVACAHSAATNFRHLAYMPRTYAMQYCSTASLLRPLRSPVSIGYGRRSPQLHMRGAALGALSASTSTGAPATAAACQQAGAAARAP